MPPPPSSPFDPLSYGVPSEILDQHHDREVDTDTTLSDDTMMGDHYDIPGSTRATATEQHQSAPGPSMLCGDSTIDFSTLSAEDRDEFYKEAFEGELPIEHINVPPLAHAYPDLGDEIIQAYMKYTTFIFRIFINYDAASELFYADTPGYNTARYNDCGKLVIYPKARAHIQSLDVGEAEYKNVRLDISTYFTTLAQITLEVRSSKLDVGPRIDAFLNQLPRCSYDLQKCLQTRIRHIEDPENDFTGGKAGFSFEDLENVAELFTLKQGDAARNRSQYKGYDGPWEGAHENPGYVKWLNQSASWPERFVH